MLIVPIGMPLRKGKSKTSLISFAAGFASVASAPLIFSVDPALPPIVASERSRSRKRSSEWSALANSFVLFVADPHRVLGELQDRPRVARERETAAVLDRALRPLADVAAGDREDDPLDGVARRAPRAHRHVHVGEALERVDVGLQHRLAAGHRIGPGARRRDQCGDRRDRDHAPEPRPRTRPVHLNPPRIAQTANAPSSCITSPSTSSRPPRRRSQTRSVCTALSLTPPDSG